MTPPPPPAAPVNAFAAPSVGKANTKKGSLALAVALPGPGTLRVAPSGKSPVKASAVTVGGAGSAAVTIKLTKDGLKKLKLKLAKAHKQGKDTRSAGDP